MNERTVLLARVGGLTVPGSTQIRADCGHECVISPTGLQTVLDPGIPTSTICLPCSGLNAAGIEKMGAAGQIGALPGAKEELSEALGEDITQALFERLHVREDL